jgi:hypothetical protein
MNVIIYIIIFLFIIIIYFDSIKIKCIYLVRKTIQHYPIYPIFKFYDKTNPTNENLLSLLHPTNQLPLLENYNIIPNILCQIYMFYTNPIPQYIFDAINQYASNYQHVIFDDKNAIQFLERYFDHRVVQRFHNIKLGAHKADLLRYCFLYVYGGIYIDIKTILIKPLDEIFINKTYFYTCIADFNTVIYNGLIGTKPRNLFLLSLIWYICDIPLFIINEPTKILGYLTFCLDFYKKIQKDLNSKSRLTEGLHIGEYQSYYLFKEYGTFTLNNTCTKFDRYGGCIDIYDKDKKIFIGRDPNFPW